MQQTVARLALDRAVRILLFSQCLAKQSQKEAEGMHIELAQLR